MEVSCRKSCSFLKAGSRDSMDGKVDDYFCWILFLKYLVIFGCSGSLVLHGIFSSCREWQLQFFAGLLSLRSTGSREHSLQQLQYVGSVIAVSWLQSTVSLVVVVGLVVPRHDMWDLPGPEIEPLSPALTGRYSLPLNHHGSPTSSSFFYFLHRIFYFPIYIRTCNWLLNHFWESCFKILVK